MHCCLATAPRVYVDELSVADVDGSWSAWTSWTECSRLCGGGTRTRHRRCDSPAASGTGQECDGHSHQLADCNTHSCQVPSVSLASPPLCLLLKVKVKFSHTRYRALGPQLIPVYRQSARR